MSKKRRLGRGLEALIPATAENTEETAARVVPTSQIQPNPHQPRGAMNEEKLAELAASIREHGLIQPLIVTKSGDGFTLIAGERRWRASQQVGLKEVPVIIKEATPQAMLELALIENIQRADLNPLEEAYAYQQLMGEFGLTQEEVAQRVGKGRSTVANLVRLTNLPQNIQQAVTAGRLSGAHARALLPLPTPEMQIAAMNQIVKLSLSVRQTEIWVKLESFNLSQKVKEAVVNGSLSLSQAQLLTRLSSFDLQNNLLNQIIARKLSTVEIELLIERHLLTKQTPQKKTRTRPSAELMALETKFEQRLGTRVNIQKGKKGGKVVIHYYSDEDLQAIYETILGQDT